jgi:hypothetical protein
VVQAHLGAAAGRQQLEPGEAERQQLEGQLGAVERQFVLVEPGEERQLLEPGEAERQLLEPERQFVQVQPGEERQLLEVEVEQGAAERQLVQIQLLGAAERHFLQN